MHRHQSIAVDGQSITFQLVDKEKGSVDSPLHVVMTILIITQAQWISHTYSSICSDNVSDAKLALAQVISLLSHQPAY